MEGKVSGETVAVVDRKSRDDSFVTPLRAIKIQKCSSKLFCP